MPYDLRYFPPYSLIEVTDVTIQNRYLLRPSEELNDRYLGVLGQAQAKYEMIVCGITVLSTHHHLLLRPKDPKHLADFMCFLKTNLSKEIGHKELHDWPGAMWRGRYHLVQVSDEEKDQVARLRYLLENSVKEFLVDRPAEWPGIHSVEALCEGKILVGTWYDRNKEHAARQLCGEDVDSKDFASEEYVELSPLPCWDYEKEEVWRPWVANMVENIEEEGAADRAAKDRTSLGAERILEIDPHHRPKDVKRSEKPRFHAKGSVLKMLLAFYAEVVQAFREASEKLLAGDRNVEFPEGTFPPHLPFVPFVETMAAEMTAARGQPV